MPLLNRIKSQLIAHLESLITTASLGVDGTKATAGDGGMGRPLLRANTTTRQLDDRTLLVEATFNSNTFVGMPIKEVGLSGATETTNPAFRADITPLQKNNQNEFRFTFIIEIE
jgi:hypothetical protein